MVETVDDIGDHVLAVVDVDLDDVVAREDLDLGLLAHLGSGRLQVGIGVVGPVHEAAVRIDAAALLPDDEAAHVDVLAVVHHGLDQTRPVAAGHTDLAGGDGFTDGGMQAEMHAAVHDPQHARCAEHADPLVVDGLGHAHPADHHAPALGVHRGLRRIEVVAVVDGLGVGSHTKVTGLGIEVGERPDGGVDHALLVVHGR